MLAINSSAARIEMVAWKVCSKCGQHHNLNDNECGHSNQQELNHSPDAFHCPIAKTHTRGKDLKIALIPYGQAIWWHCTECDGWHVKIADSEEKS